MIKELWGYLEARYRKNALLTPILILAEVFMEVFIPLQMAKIINLGVLRGEISAVVRYGAGMIVMALLSLLFGVLAARTSVIASVGFAKNIREALFQRVQDYSFANIDRFSTASLITRLTADVNNMQMAFMMCIRMLVRSPVMLVSATFMAFYINARLALVFLLVIPVLGTALGWIASKTYPRFQVMLEKYDNLNARVQENLTAIRVVKAFVREPYEVERFSGAAQDLRAAQVRAEKLLVLNGPIMQLCMYSCMIAISWFGGRLIIGGSMEPGDLMSFISYVSQILMSLMMLSIIFVMLIMSRASAMRIREVLNEPLDLTDANVSGDPQVEDGSIRFEHVGFAYSREAEVPNLQDITLSIASGETIGILGGTGSGKSTLAQLIPRLYDAQEGRVLVGGRDVKEYRLETLRRQVAMVLQKNVLFSGTIRENLVWGDENATDEQIEEACRAAQAHEFITGFPDGYQTELGQGGVNLSGGQKQRLCIARALLSHPKIVILDDSTSAVDTATDSKIRAAFREKLKGTTTLIIAQRIASVMDADRIIVMNDGKIDAIGTHEQLLEHNAIYREVFESQQKGVA
ncbi:MAG: ABC transporter ATP-binding protein [Clostridia bacterium]|nr:ABC transporter ATP-binding protein [Clostridia bacterium]